MYSVFKISKSGYYKWLHKAPGKREVRSAMLEKEIEAVYRASKGRYGSPRVTKELNMRGIAASKVLVAKVMQRLHLQSIVGKRCKATTDSSHRLPIAENVLDRQFEATKENSARVSDITHIATGEGWPYLTTVIDLFDRKVIGWALSDTMKASQTTVAAFRMAAKNRPINHFSPWFFIPTGACNMPAKNSRPCWTAIKT